ncbi:hypothetical protein ACNVED_01235 [Legionella sp. D16C41]|uniref:hypothetical protein n=1 Tax=Legionella sp. D16C41 TaxID=3402688 RepID=UPI003AF87282
MLVYTSITKSYLPKARILAKSVKRFHPDWQFVLLYSDDLPRGFDLNKEPFDEIITVEQLGFSNCKAWVFGHALVELCTAVKGPAAKVFAQRPDVDKIMYLDPDIKVFNSLSPLESLLNQHEIILTPHLLETEEGLPENEMAALKHGIYNLGFFAARTSGQGLAFIHWWAERLSHFCRDDIPSGLFTDQRWCDLAPAFFSNLGIVRDHGCNVATWNIAKRPLSLNEDGIILAGNTPLRFYHFTGYDNGSGFTMLMKYASKQVTAHKLWEQYGKELLAEGHGKDYYKGWFYGQFDNGEAIPPEARKLYRARQDLQQAFPNPFSIDEPCYLSWWKAEINLNNKNVLEPVTVAKSNRFKKIITNFSSRRTGLNLLKSAMIILKNEGFFALMRRIRNYS